MAQAKRSTTGEQVGDNMVEAEVGHGFRETKEVPEELGEFTLWDCPNDGTINYYRDYTPTEEMTRPALREKFAITTRGEGQYDVVRGVTLRKDGAFHNVRTGEEHGSVVVDTLDRKPVGVEFESFEAALNHATRLIEAASLTDKPPKEVGRFDNPILSAFRDMRIEAGREDGSDESGADGEGRGGDAA